jgi:hypothetical protein
MTDAPAIVENAAPSETLEQSIARLADIIGGLNPKRWGKHEEIDRVKFELPRMPGMNMHTLSALLELPEANEVIQAKCNHCETTVECRRVVAPFVACNACIQKHTDDAAVERHRKYWESVCPKRFIDTDTKREDFPLAIYNAEKKRLSENPSQSFFLFGPTGSCKTRVAMLLLKLNLHWWNKRVGVLWPEKVRMMSQGFETTVFDHYAAFDVLVMDDVLLTACRESKLVDAVKQLVDVRMRENRPFIITSQIGTEEDLTEAKEFGDAKNADQERIKALLRRLREECRVVSFAKAEPKEGEEKF